MSRVLFRLDEDGDDAHVLWRAYSRRDAERGIWCANGARRHGDHRGAACFRLGPHKQVHSRPHPGCRRKDQHARAARKLERERVRRKRPHGPRRVSERCAQTGNPRRGHPARDGARASCSRTRWRRHGGAGARYQSSWCGVQHARSTRRRRQSKRQGWECDRLGRGRHLAARSGGRRSRRFVGRRWPGRALSDRPDRMPCGHRRNGFPPPEAAAELRSGGRCSGSTCRRLALAGSIDS